MLKATCWLIRPWRVRTCARVCVRVFSGWSFAYGRVARGGSTIVTRTRQRMSTSGNYFTGIFYGGLFSVDAPLPCPRPPGPGVSELFMWTGAYWRRVNLSAVRWEVLSSCARAEHEDQSGHNITVGYIFGGIRRFLFVLSVFFSERPIQTQNWATLYLRFTYVTLV